MLGRNQASLARAHVAGGIAGRDLAWYPFRVTGSGGRRNVGSWLVLAALLCGCGSACRMPICDRAAQRPAPQKTSSWAQKSSCVIRSCIRSTVSLPCGPQPEPTVKPTIPGTEKPHINPCVINTVIGSAKAAASKLGRLCQTEVFLAEKAESLVAVPYIKCCHVSS